MRLVDLVSKSLWCIFVLLIICAAYNIALDEIDPCRATEESKNSLIAMTATCSDGFFASGFECYYVSYEGTRKHTGQKCTETIRVPRGIYDDVVNRAWDNKNE